ncbi:MAG TPA: sulfite exporter TauE/SafE family protein [Methyloprofundus sp.]|jgi:sulfite exporter TauE/SafE|uniref:sulfite exporter TauE/SafE family protein n=1 Tax=Methyloprofundus sp. TaxID=2020875 RepID=UPI00178D585F|nr:sulfite exporter TauE/SafE family protein [Methyloprofundus sp.]MBT3813425.1 sulfite exporter TauE/SafE family protein [Gammaproteobacteria bacterium]HIL77592.1 sulfite exporter TauE/SafE family protein [Methylococcales bacterium]MBT5222887.1 sulfite exporter TauE/SafE family protein [Gammaproteobacteria bacterium]MBT5825472.1 sulfite exporter TauE/SafE family protein [Gammaproteobacteria bacterium]MBT5967438.1 sulfite exporter TauE/SafE family protein [Gammaproteobacteria bacterium]
MEISQVISSPIFIAFFIGLFSSLHCVSMCGSIIGTLSYSLKPEIRNNKSKMLTFIFSYNFGRIFSYMLAGLIIGFIESIVTLPLGADHGHRVLQIISALIITGAGFYIAGWFPSFAYIEKTGSFFWKTIEPYGRKLIPVATLPQAFLFGMVWGWIPCGLVYTALALAATSGDILTSMLSMLTFGLGTLPAVAGSGMVSSFITRLSNLQTTKKIIGMLLVVVAIFSI